MVAPPHEATCSHSDDPIETLPPCVPSPVEGKLVVTHSPMENDTIILVDASPLFSPHSVAPSNYGVDFDSLEKVGIDAEEGSGSKPIIPTSRRRYKWTTKRIVKFAAICKSLFVTQCLTQFLKITHQESEILCDMHGVYITRDEFSLLNGGRWLNSVVSFQKLIQVVLGSLLNKAKKHEIRDRCCMFLDVEIVGHDFSTCELVLQTSRVEIFSSLPLRKGNDISVVTRRLYDYGMFAIKYKQYWNGATLAYSLAEDKIHLYRLSLVINLVMNDENNAREKVM
ncbi:hypothetical protein AAG906_016578 [Vitis piasezkii]